MRRPLRYSVIACAILLVGALVGCGFRAEQQTLRNITVTAQASMVRGTTQQMTAMGQYTDGTNRQLSSEVVWTSSNTAIATVSPTGVVTGIALGTATISASVGAVSGVAPVSVEIHLTGISVNSPASVIKGQTQQLVVTGTYDDRSTAPVTNATWTTSNAAIATVSGGVVTGVAMGTVNVTAAAGGFTAVSAVSVTGYGTGTVTETGTTTSPITVAGHNPITGTTVDVPPGAVDPGEKVTINIDYESALPAPLPDGFNAASVVVVLMKDMVNNFNIPVNVTIPVDATLLAAGEVPVVFFWNSAYNTYEATSLVNIDTTANKVTFQTTHFSKFIAATRKGGWNLGQDSVDTGFKPGADGFFHPNFGSYVTPGGSSLGMTLYSSWYYAHKKGTTPAGTGFDTSALFGKYRQDDVNRWQDDTNARELISRTYAASSVVWGKVALDYANENLSAGHSAQALLTAMAISKTPQILLLRGTSQWAQAVLVYGWDSQAQRFRIYDPNFPGDDSITLGWDAIKGASNYSKGAAYPDAIQKGAFHGLSVAVAGTEFEGLYAGAEGGWNSSDFVQIKVNTPTLDSNGVVVVPDNSALTVQGSVTGGKKVPTAIVVYLNGKRIDKVPVSSNAFNFSLPQLPQASNSVMLVATDNPRDPWAAYAGFQQFTIKVQGQVFFANAGFETGDWTGWTHETHEWFSSTPYPPGYEKSAIVNATDMDERFPNITKGYVGKYAARVNNYDDSYHISTASQTVTVPNVANPEVRFYWIAILEDPQHDPANQPYVDITVTDVTDNKVLYNKHFYSNDPAYSGWVGTYWKTFKDWQTLTLNLGGVIGHQVKVTVTGADCGYGGHGGYVYLDGDEQ